MPLDLIACKVRASGEFIMIEHCVAEITVMFEFCKDKVKYTFSLRNMYSL